ncbi:MAG: UvrD-helicase domain-containing protein [Bacilli bacterium]|jgi:ATP-dependent helicase/nuclease subunit A|nr:UvrD-helicase domain-containing protein [Bacilli bacterium]
MKFEDFNPIQQEAITSDGENIIVSAGAGSGKTEVLSQRVSYFIRKKGYTLDNFLILTFTNLAAGEMRSRIRKQLTADGLKEGEDVDRADIMTFDAYALALVKKYHFLLKVSADLTLVDEAVISVRKRTLIEEIYEEYYQEQKADFTSMIKRFCLKDDKSLTQLTFDFWTKADKELDTSFYLDTYVDTYYSEEKVQEIEKALCQKIIALRESLRPLFFKLPSKEVGKKKKPYKDAVVEAYSKFMAVSSYDDLISSFKEMKVLKPSAPKGTASDEGKKAFDDAEKELAKLILSLPQDENLLRKSLMDLKPFAALQVEIVKEAEKRLQAFKEEKQAYEFEDIAKMALNLVKDHPQVKAEIQKKLKMIMVDEYQDTSLLQESFINEIANHNVYMVGDIKQSIYRFRDARCDIFQAKYEAYKNHQGGKAIDMNVNFRSRKEVLEDINYLFKGLMTKEVGGADYVASHQIGFGNYKAYEGQGDNKENNHTAIFAYPEEKHLDQAAYEAEIIVKDIIKKVNEGYQVVHKKEKDEKKKTEDGDQANKKKDSPLENCTYSDFCIIMDRHGAFEEYAKVFSRYQVPLYIQNDEDVSSNQVVLVLASLLRMVKAIEAGDYESGDFIHAFLSLARSFLFSYTDQELYDLSRTNGYKDDKLTKKIQEIVEDNQELPVYELVKKLVFELEVYKHLLSLGDVKTNEGYIDFFLQMFKSMSELDYSLDDFLLFLEYVDTYDLRLKLPANGSETDSVTLMNIHKSKGLEYPIIYYSGLMKGFYRQDMDSEFGVSSSYGLILPTESVKTANVVKMLNKDQELKEDTSEKIRLLYVALTRAKEKITLLLPYKDFEALKMKSVMQDGMRIYQDLKNLGMDTEENFCTLYLENIINSDVLNLLVYQLHLNLPLGFSLRSVKERKKLTYKEIRNFRLNEESYQASLNSNPVKKEDQDEIMEALYKSVKAGKKDVGVFFVALIAFRGISFVDIVDGKGYDLFFTSSSKEDLIFRIERLIPPGEEESHCDIGDIPEGGFLPPYEPFMMDLIDDCKDGKLTPALLHKGMKILGYETNEDFSSFFPEGKEVTEKAIEELKAHLFFTLDETSFVAGQEEICILRLLFKAYKNKDLTYEEFKTLARRGLFPFKEAMEKAYKLYGEDKLNAGELTLFAFAGGYLLNKEYLLANQNKPNLDNYEFLDLFEPEACLNITKDEEKNLFAIFHKLYSYFANGVFKTDTFDLLLNIFGYEFSSYFLYLSEEEKKAVPNERIDDIFALQSFTMENREEVKSLGEFLLPYLSYDQFVLQPVDEEIDPETPLVPYKAVVHQSFNIIDTAKPFKEVIQERASKELNLTSSKAGLEFGTLLHEGMEATDFKNPDYAALKDPTLIQCVKRFLDSSLMKDIKDGEIYKEYEFIDEAHKTRGIIDLMVVYQDHLDIIDYKTKDISDEVYLKQLSIYKAFAEEVFKKPTKTYLYSLLTGEVKEGK